MCTLYILFTFLVVCLLAWGLLQIKPINRLLDKILGENDIEEDEDDSTK